MKQSFQMGILFLDVATDHNVTHTEVSTQTENVQNKTSHDEMPQSRRLPQYESDTIQAKKGVAETDQESAGEKNSTEVHSTYDCDVSDLDRLLIICTTLALHSESSGWEDALIEVGDGKEVDDVSIGMLEVNKEVTPQTKNISCVSNCNDLQLNNDVINVEDNDIKSEIDAAELQNKTTAVEQNSQRQVSMQTYTTGSASIECKDSNSINSYFTVQSVTDNGFVCTTGNVNISKARKQQDLSMKAVESNSSEASRRKSGQEFTNKVAEDQNKEGFHNSKEHKVLNKRTVFAKSGNAVNEAGLEPGELTTSYIGVGALEPGEIRNIDTNLSNGDSDPEPGEVTTIDPPAVYNGDGDNCVPGALSNFPEDNDIPDLKVQVPRTPIHAGSEEMPILCPQPPLLSGDGAESIISEGSEMPYVTAVIPVSRSRYKPSEIHIGQTETDLSDQCEKVNKNGYKPGNRTSFRLFSEASTASDEQYVHNNTGEAQNRQQATTDGTQQVTNPKHILHRDRIRSSFIEAQPSQNIDQIIRRLDKGNTRVERDSIQESESKMCLREKDTDCLVNGSGATSSVCMDDSNVWNWYSVLGGYTVHNTPPIPNTKRDTIHSVADNIPLRHKAPSSTVSVTGTSSMQGGYNIKKVRIIQTDGKQIIVPVCQCKQKTSCKQNIVSSHNKTKGMFICYFSTNNLILKPN